MSRHKNPWAKLEALPVATRYYWQAKLNRVYTLCVWAGCRKCKVEDRTITPTLDAIWGTQGFSCNVYLNSRTNEMRVAIESPGADWDCYGHMDSSNDTSSRLLNGINLTFLAVETLFQQELSRKHIESLCYLLPVVGKFQGEFWEGSENKAVASEVLTLRDINHAKAVEVAAIVNIEERINNVMSRRCVQDAIVCLENNAPIVPRKHRPQRDLDFGK